MDADVGGSRVWAVLDLGPKVGGSRIWDPELGVYDLGASAELWDGGGDRRTMLGWMHLRGEDDDAHEESS